MELSKFQIKNQKGMTLLEVMVAMAIAAVALVALTRIYSHSINIQPRLEMQYMSALLAENILLEVQLIPPLGTEAEAEGRRAMGNYVFDWNLEFDDTKQRGLGRAKLELRSAEIDASSASDNYQSFTGFFINANTNQ